MAALGQVYPQLQRNLLDERYVHEVTGSGDVRGGATCPVKAVKAWLQAANISDGPLFRPVAKGGRLGAQRLTDKSVCDLVKAYAERLGLKATDFGAHSLRAGFLTSAARRGASVFKMRDVSRHKRLIAAADFEEVSSLEKVQKTVKNRVAAFNAPAPL